MKRRFRVAYVWTWHLREWRWALVGKGIGSRGRLLFAKRADAIRHAQWEARHTGATVRIQCRYGAEDILEIEGEGDAGEGLKLCGTL